MRRGGKALPDAVWRAWPTRSHAKVSFLLGEQRAAERVVRRLFGERLLPHEYAGLVGAPDSASVEVGASDGKLYIELRDPLSTACGFYYLFSDKKTVVLCKDGFRIHAHAMRRGGLGLQIFFRQARNAAALGIRWIQAFAGRSSDENGYYTWPRFGFQCPLPPSILRNLPAGLEQSRTVLGLMSSEKGRGWWREHGAPLQMQFDLAPGSRCRRTLLQYVREKVVPFHAGSTTASSPVRFLEHLAASPSQD